jgi:hypothetical protein
VPGPAARPPRLSWAPVAVAGSVALALVACVVAWAATHPVGRTRKVVAFDEAPPRPPAERAALPAEPVVSPEPQRDQPPVAEPQRPEAAPVEPVVVPARPEAAQEPPKQPARGPVEAPADVAAPACETFGTRVEFDTNPTRAAKRAADTQRLLMVLHISGNFEDAGFT